MNQRRRETEHQNLLPFVLFAFVAYVLVIYQHVGLSFWLFPVFSYFFRICVIVLWIVNRGCLLRVLSTSNWEKTVTFIILYSNCELWIVCIVQPYAKREKNKKKSISHIIKWSLHLVCVFFFLLFFSFMNCCYYPRSAFYSFRW